MVGDAKRNTALNAVVWLRADETRGTVAKTENDAQFRARIQKEGIESVVHERCAERIRNGEPQPSAWMATRNEYTPDDIVLHRSNDKGQIERACAAKAEEKKQEVEAASKGTCTNPEAIQWVAENITDPHAGKSNPGKIALSLWTWARMSETNKSEFFKNIWPRILPSQKELDNQARYKDDGSTQIELAERILARIAENAA